MAEYKQEHENSGLTVSWSYVITYQIVYFKYMHFVLCDLCHNKALKNKKEFRSSGRRNNDNLALESLKTNFTFSHSY